MHVHETTRYSLKNLLNCYLQSNFFSVAKLYNVVNSKEEKSEVYCENCQFIWKLLLRTLLKLNHVVLKRFESYKLLNCTELILNSFFSFLNLKKPLNFQFFSVKQNLQVDWNMMESETTSGNNLKNFNS